MKSVGVIDQAAQDFLEDVDQVGGKVFIDAQELVVWTPDETPDEVNADLSARADENMTAIAAAVCLLACAPRNGEH